MTAHAGPGASVVLAGLVATAPATINIGGYEPETVGLVLSMVTVLAVRLLVGFNDRTPGATRRETLKTVLAAVLVFAADLNLKPGPGMAVIIGAGVGIAIATLLDIAARFVVRTLENLLGRVPPPGP